MRRGSIAAWRHVQLIHSSGSVPLQQLQRLVCYDELHGAARSCCDAHLVRLSCVFDNECDRNIHSAPLTVSPP